MPRKNQGTRPHVVILGAGFGGIKAAKLLADKNVDVTIVDKHNYHLFQPLLYQVSTSILSEDEISYPIRAFFQKNENIDFFMAEATGFDPANKIVKTSHGDISYDYLIIATGATTNYFGMKSVEEHSYPMKTLRESTLLRNHLIRTFERASRVENDKDLKKALMTIMIVGGGPTGVEEAGAISELVYKCMKKDYHNLNMNDVDIKLIEATDKLLPMMPEALRNNTVDVLRGKKVDVRLNTQVRDYDGEYITLKCGEKEEKIRTRTVIWAAGVKAQPVVATLGAEVDRAGRVIVEKTTQVKGFPDIYAIGDSAHFEQDGRPLPTIAPAAYEAAETTVKNIMHAIKGEEQETFVYKDLGSMATIGAGDAVMFKGVMKSKGLFAWIAWMAVHVLRLAGPLTNCTVIFKWVMNYFFGVRMARIVRD